MGLREMYIYLVFEIIMIEVLRPTHARRCTANGMRTSDSDFKFASKHVHLRLQPEPERALCKQL